VADAMILPVCAPFPKVCDPSGRLDALSGHRLEITNTASFGSIAYHAVRAASKNRLLLLRGGASGARNMEQHGVSFVVF